MIRNGVCGADPLAVRPSEAASLLALFSGCRAEARRYRRPEASLLALFSDPLQVNVLILWDIVALFPKKIPFFKLYLA